MSTLDKSTPTQLQAGLSKDMNFQKPGDVTFALNGIRDAHDGGKYEYQSEPGNELVESIRTGYTFMGSINGNNNEVYIFATNNSGSGTIGIFREGNYTEEVLTTFDWNTNYPITGEFRVKNGCENIIYWCNGDAPDGHYNFDRPELFQDGSGNWVVNKFKLVADVIPPKIDLKSVNDSGGILPLGSYYFQAEYLDANLNSIYKTDVSPQVVIFDDSLGEAYNRIDGGLNIAQYTEESGGVPITTKSITLTLSNLDTQFAYIRINVARQLTGIQTVDAHAVSRLIPINDDTIDFTYTGYDVSIGDYPVDYSEIITDNIRYDTAYVMEQVQGRLLRARLKQGVRDYSQYQKYASKVEVKWVAKEVLSSDINEDGAAKNPKTYWEATTFQGDEIYAIYERFLHTDGSWSPLFNNPGRVATATDLELLDVIDNADPLLNPTDVWQSDVDHLGLNVGDTVERWKVFNTAVLTDSNVGSHPYDYEGEMGYYEADTTYPDIKDCDDVLIWGEDELGDPILTTDKIRHHRFPDRRLIPHVSGTDFEYIVPLGIKFDNIEYPNSDVIGHQFFYVKRGDFNKTVLDSGWFIKVLDDNDLELDNDTPDPLRGVLTRGTFPDSHTDPGDTDQITGQYGAYNSADVFFNQKIYNPSYIKYNSTYEHDITGGVLGSGGFGAGIEVPRTGGGSIGISLFHFDNVALSGITDRTNFKVESQVYVPPQGFVSASVFDVNVRNSDRFTATNVIKVSYDLPNTDSIDGSYNYVYKKTNIKPYQSLFANDFKYINYNYNSSLDTEDNIYYNGDCLISLCHPTKNDSGGPSGSTLYAVGTFIGMWEEREINGSLRHGGTSPQGLYYKADGNYFTVLAKLAELQDDNTYLPFAEDAILTEYYAYNKDYDKQSLESAKSVLPITYNYCSDCLGVFDNKIVWSPKSFDDESFDLYRINKVNDSITIPGNRGKITGLKYQNDYLLTHTENSLYILQPNPQSLATDISSVYLTTGGFLSLPPNEIVQNDIGYAGCQSKQHMCETPDGHAWCDQKRGQIFIFNTKLSELSMEQSGMTQWFKQELPSYLEYDFYQIMNLDYPNDSTYSVVDNGIGIIMYYDPRFKRLIISKKDFKPINLVAEGNNPGSLKYDIDANDWYYINDVGGSVVTYFSNATYFENKSWTISYSFNTGNFTSWHSYRPFAAFSDSLNYYTLTSSLLAPTLIRNIYRHKHFNSYQNFYGTKYFFVVEWMTSDFSTDNMSSLHYNGYALQWDATNKKWKTVDSTFQYAHIYSFDQSTDTFPITLLNQQTNPYGNIGFSNTQKYVIKTDQNYKIAGIYDVATASPVVTSDWTFLKNFVGYIDQLVLAANHNNAKTAYALGNIKDKFVYCRLFYQPAQDYKKVITLGQTNETRSIR